MDSQLVNQDRKSLRKSRAMSSSMDVLSPERVSSSLNRLGKSSLKMDALTKGGSLAGKSSWTKVIRSYTDNIQLYLGRAHSVSVIDSSHGSTDDKESWSSSSSSTEDEGLWLRRGSFVFQSRTSVEHQQVRFTRDFRILRSLTPATSLFTNCIQLSSLQEYLVLNSDSGIDDVARFMIRTWHLPVPKVIVSVISSVDYFVVPNESWVEDLQYGILQSARLTNMYILTDGLNSGAARLIGEAVAQERLRRHLASLGDGVESSSEVGHITAIGVVASNQLRYGHLIEDTFSEQDGSSQTVLENIGDDKRELNPHHSHSIIVNGAELPDKDAAQSMINNLQYRLPWLFYREKKKGKSSSPNLHEDIKPNKRTRVPLVGLMLHGGPAEIDRVLWMLRKQVPVVVIIRKATASGLLAYAFKEYLRSDVGRVEQVLKPQLMSRVQEAFPEYCGDSDLLGQQVRDRILDCVKVAIQGDRHFLFLLDPNNTEEDLKDLNKFILAAILSIRGGTEGLTRESMNWTLRLALRWNRVDFVAKNILNPNYISRFRVRDDLFVEALLLRDREPFVELFLSMGFLLQRLMTYEQVLKLFQASLNEEFFVKICLKHILRKKEATLGTRFMHEKACELNKILCMLSGLTGLVEPSHLLLPQLSNKTNSHILEKRALLTILYWAVLTNRKGLVKVLWKRSAEPIAVALVISNMYYRMSKYYIKDIDLKSEIKQSAVEFGQLAIKIMDLTFNDSRLLAFHSLTNPLPEFNNLNVVDLALIGNNIFFIAHPCCQRSMRERWFGNIKIKSYGSALFNVPEYVKIYLCMLLVFPMYFWLSFKPVRRAPIPAQDQDDDDREIPNKNFSNSVKDPHQSKIMARRVYKAELQASPNIFMKIYYLWTAPIAKFWLNQMFVVFYLTLYAIAVMLPYCGNPTINWLLCIWTLLLILENVTRTIQRHKKFPTMDVMWPLFEFLAEMSTVVVLLLHLLGGYFNFTTYKLLMGLSLLAVYFSALRDTLTASRELGPMLVNIMEITRKDLINWFQLWLMWLISGGLAIQIVIYPAQPFSLDILWRAMLRALLGIWLTEIDDLEGDTTCSSLYRTEEISHTCDAFVLRRLENCPNASVAGYVVIILYILVTRLIFLTLVFAMFSNTIDRTQVRSVELWKYQFQTIVTEFESRPVIPPPLDIITYPFRLSYLLGNVAMEIMLEYCACCRYDEGRKDQSTAIPYNQWKSYLSQISRQEEEKEDKVHDVINCLDEESAKQNFAIKHLTDHLVQIERHQTMTAIYLEDLKKKLDALGKLKPDAIIKQKDSWYNPPDPKVRIHTELGQEQKIHELSRMSPYPGTDIHRCPLLDQTVSWDTPYEAYDPATYSKPIEEYPPEDQPYVDIDILSLPIIGGHYMTPQGAFHAGSIVAPTNPVPFDADSSVASFQTSGLDITYNVVQTSTLASGREVAVDRRTYITDDGQPMQYNIDSSGVPINPMGRTGLRGRGLLNRWGPNHLIRAVISRFTPAIATSTSTFNNPNQRPTNMEILVRVSPDGGNLSLIGGLVRPNKSSYSTLCDIICETFTDTVADHGPNDDQEEMIHTFSKFASTTHGKKSKAGFAAYGYSAYLVYNGYEDSQVNTDNAWQEVEIFNFHYKHRDNFNSRGRSDENVVWQTVTEHMALSACDMAAVKEAEKIRTNVSS